MATFRAACSAMSRIRPVAARLNVVARGPMTSMMSTVPRTMSTASEKISKVLGSEIKHEEEQYEQAKEIKQFLKDSKFKLVEKAGDVNMALERELDGKTVRIEWQLTSPFDPAMDEEDAGDQMPHEATEFSVSVENKEGAGMMFHCTTQTGEDHRYVIGNIQVYANTEAKDCRSSYLGPEFEDLDDKLQESLDEYLGELGMNNEVCDFVDAMAVDKEQREYVQWLKTAKNFLA